MCSPGGRKQLIVFCDASGSACCAVIYVRDVKGENTVLSVNFLCAKTMIAPKKNDSIFRLERISALMLAKLVNRVRGVLKIELNECFLFSDATVVLFWLSKPAEEWKIFVSNRVSSIQKLVLYPQWYYVNTKKNLADLATRGLTADNFLSSKDWFNSPDFLKEYEISSDPIPNINVSEVSESRKSKVCCLNLVSNSSSMLERFSSFNRLIRVFCYVKRFINNCQKKTYRKKCFLNCR